MLHLSLAASRPAIENPKTEVTKLQNYRSCKVTEVTKLQELQSYRSYNVTEVARPHFRRSSATVVVRYAALQFWFAENSAYDVATIWHTIPSKDIPRAHEGGLVE